MADEGGWVSVKKCTFVLPKKGIIKWLVFVTLSLQRGIRKEGKKEGRKEGRVSDWKRIGSCYITTKGYQGNSTEGGGGNLLGEGMGGI